MKHFFSLAFFLFSLFIYKVQAQQITTDSSISLEQLILNNLAEGCVEITNISSTVNGQSSSLESYGYFEKASSNFPFENGIVLSTGSVNSAGNTTNSAILAEGDDGWGTDNDLETALGISNTLNATSIEFDFVSFSNQVQFNYLLASEEYYEDNPCNYSDGFAFLIKEAGTTNPYTNIALIPGTSTPVNTKTIHQNIVGFCAAQNEAYFDGFGSGDTNFNGRTTVLTANTSITPNVKYHIKLVIADQTDYKFDSAVFIEGNSFNATVDLGPDLSTCANTVDLNGDINNNLATYAWYLNDNLIAGEKEATYTALTSGIYKVEITLQVNESSCIIEDEIEVTLNGEQSSGDISDFILCDDSTNDGFESFDLNLKYYEILYSVPSGTYNITYHKSEDDAKNNNNPITSNFTNTSNPQIIYVRIEDTVNGCLAYPTFNLVVNESPKINKPAPLIVCDDQENDGFTIIDLWQANDEITGGDSSLQVTYHYTQEDADSGWYQIYAPYTNVNLTDTLYVRVYNSFTGCHTTTTIDVTVQENPDIDKSRHWINKCVEDEDGIETFDLTTVIPSVLEGITNATTTFHISEEDALADQNAIANQTSYNNITPYFQLVYIRVEDDTTGCFSISTVELQTNLVLYGINYQDYVICDDYSDDGQEYFNLLDVEKDIKLDYGDLDIVFYESQDDLDNQTNPIDKNTPYLVTSSLATLYTRVVDDVCVVDFLVDLIIKPALVLPEIDSVDYCDTDTDGYTSILLETFNRDLTKGISPVSINYYLTEVDALNDENRLGETFYNWVNPQQVFIRVSNTQSGCVVVKPIDINIITAPVVGYPDNIIICDDDQDERFVVDVTASLPQVVADTTDLDITYYDDYWNAVAGENPMDNPTAYNAINGQYLYFRVQSKTTSCYNISWVYVNINTLPVFQDISIFENCESDANDEADFYFYLKDSDVLNGQYGKDVLYFETAQDAIDRTNIIDKYSAYKNTSNPQTVHVRVESYTDQECFGTSSFELEVGSVPLFNEPEDIPVCDDISNDGSETFDLNPTIDFIKQGIADNLTVTLHTSSYDAEYGYNPIDPIFTNYYNPQSIYVRITNGTYCHGITDFTLSVIQVPNTTTPSPLVVCDADYDGLTTFDLTLSELEILDLRQNNLVITYHTTEEGVDMNTDIITDPENYNNTNNPETVYIKINNTISNCSVSLPINLQVDIPPTINDFQEHEICDNSSNYFNLNTISAKIVDNDPDAVITYHASNTEAENGTNAFNTDYTYNTTSDIIYTRIESVTRGCHYVYPFQLIVSPVPVANQPSDMETCDDASADTYEIFNLRTQDSAVYGSQNPNNFTITYHDSNNAAINGESALSDNYNAQDGQIIYARIENNITGCFDNTQFNIVVHDYPNQVTPLVQCDVDYNETVVFNISENESNLFATTSSNITISYFDDFSLIDDDASAIADPVNYTNKGNPQIIYIKAYNISADCYNVIEQELNVTLPPAINEFETHEICDNPARYFDLNIINNIIVTNNSDAVITYYTNSADAEARLGAISTDYTYNTIKDIIYIRVESAARGCHFVYPFQLIVTPLPTANQPNNMETCDDESADKFEVFNLRQQDNSIYGNQNPNNFTITYYDSNNSAINKTSALPDNFNAQNQQTIFARIENNNTGCYSTTQFTTIVHDHPNQVAPLVQCDIDYDETVVFDVSQNESDLFVTASANIVVSYFDDFSLLDDDASAISNPKNYTNKSNPQTIYIKVFNTSANCYNVVEQELNVTSPPAINQFTTHEICDNPTRYFNLNEINTIIVNNDADALITYYANATNAELGTDAISTDYTYKSFSDTIYIRIESATRGCHYVYPFQLIVNPLPIANKPSDIEACDTDYDNIYGFDFSQQNSFILGSQNPDVFNLSYYLTEDDAITKTNTLANIHQVDVESMIYARIENIKTGCFSTTNFMANVRRKPINSVEDQVICLENFPLVVNGETDFTNDTYLWLPNGETSASIEITEIGTYSLTITSVYGCQTTNTFNVIESEQANIEITETVDFSDPNNITITVSGIGDYYYQLDEDEPQRSNFFQNVGIGPHLITVIDANGCLSVSKEVMVIDVPKFVTPNGDGQFDTWHITGVNQLVGTIIYIYNRQGKLLKTLPHTATGWDGTYHGVNMPTDDYWYLAHVFYKGKEFELKGHFTLKR